MTSETDVTINFCPKCKNQNVTVASLRGNSIRCSACGYVGDAQSMRKSAYQKIIEKKTALPQIDNKTEGKKFDQNKLRPSLFPIQAFLAILKVLEYGAEKYELDNWKKVRPTVRYYDAALRHLMAWRQGEKLDEESGLPHLAHAACCIVFLLYFQLMEEK